MAEDLLELDVAALGPRLRRRELSPVEVTQAYLERIARLDPRLRAYITVTAEHALDDARRAERELSAGNWRGPLHGVPVALKDLCCTAGILTTAGSRILADFVPDHDSTVWKRLREAGAVLLGKLSLHEFAYGATNTNPHWGTARNPYDPERIPGGSSGGSGVAIVARMAAATIGTDTGGSIRIPAALCGCVGLKPTFSRVSRHGVIPLAPTLDHVGPITRTVRDAALMLKVIAGYDSDDSTSSREPVPDLGQSLDAGVKGLRLGVIRELASGLLPRVEQSFTAALRVLGALGAEIDEVSVPSSELGPMVTGAIMWAEALEYHETWLRTRPQDYGEDVRRQLELGMATTATTYIRAQRARARMLAQAMAALEGRDALVAPAVGAPAAPIGERRKFVVDGVTVDPVTAYLRFTAPFNATGQPALAVPSGLGADGLPLSLQIVGRPFDEATVLRVAAAYEQARGPLPPPAL